MFLKKFFFSLSVASLGFFFYLSSCLNLSVLGLSSLLFYKEGFPYFNLSLCMDTEMVLFFFMVLMVTCLVSLYSEFYMDHYNFKKYSMLMMSFFIFMLILASSNSFLNFLVGWDGLGVSSLCLIMFYPNKTSSYNSFLTFFFNRLGDILLMMVFGFIFCEELFLWYVFEDFSLPLLIMLALCSFTKGAQFPLSSWLPAAMSAPTPISAMVHSSTLVTAGLYLLYKIYFHLQENYMCGFVFFVASTTFLIGGFLANIEMDLKKIVAFSTMSQISMITMFMFLGFLLISIFHMFNHALFKTLIFCSCGYLFVFNSSDQSSFTMSQTSMSYYLYFSIFLSVFMMTGFQFSSSFLTKDLIMECVSDVSTNFTFSIFIVGGVMTLFYCGSIFNSFFSSLKSIKKKFLSMKFFHWNFLGLVCLTMVSISFVLSKFMLVGSSPVVSYHLIYFIIVILTIPLILGSRTFGSWIFFSQDLLYSKNFIFSKCGNQLTMDSNSFFTSEQMMFKPFSLKMNFKLESMSYMNFSLVFLMLFLWFLVFLV